MSNILSLLFISLVVSAGEKPVRPTVAQAQSSASSEAEKGRAVNLETIAANEAIDAYVIAGGGGSSSGAAYSLQGTIGQAAAGGPISGGSFSVSSGFWNSVSGAIATPPKTRRGQVTSQ